MSQESPFPVVSPGPLVWGLREAAILVMAAAAALLAGRILGAAALGPLLVHATVLAWVIVAEHEKLRGWFRVRVRDAVLGLVGGAGLLAAGHLNVAALAALGVDVPDVAADLREVIPLGSLLVWAAVLVPVAEEAFFRGRLPDALAPRIGPGGALTVSSLLFAMAHGLPPLVPVYVLFAIVLWALRERTGALVAPIVAHAVNNAIGIVPWSG